VITAGTVYLLEVRSTGGDVTFVRTLELLG